VALLGGIPVAVQTVRVDATAPVNTIRPREAVGAGIDRIPVEAIDRDLTKQALVPVLESGWQPVTYRRNTELVVEAWHRNPEGTWSGGGGKAALSGPACRPASYVAPMDTDCRIAASRDMTAREKPATRD
jgi:hypothetical protein